jgi:hypothetical protein
LIEIRDCVRTLIDMQTEDYPDEEIVEQQLRLNSLYCSSLAPVRMIFSLGKDSKRL